MVGEILLLDPLAYNLFILGVHAKSRSVRVIVGPLVTFSSFNCLAFGFLASVTSCLLLTIFLIFLKYHSFKLLALEAWKNSLKELASYRVVLHDVLDLIIC